VQAVRSSITPPSTRRRAQQEGNPRVIVLTLVNVRSAQGVFVGSQNT
jgi:hypothetical protein